MRMIIPQVVLFLMVSITSAQTQELKPPFSMVATDTCLANLERVSAELCIGESAELCSFENPGSYAMAACFSYEHEQWDKRLNIVYGQLMAREKAHGRAQELRNMEREWIKARDARCDYDVIAEEWNGGTGTAPAIAQCLMEMTGMQTLLLLNMLEGG